MVSGRLGTRQPAPRRRWGWLFAGLLALAGPAQAKDAPSTPLCDGTSGRISLTTESFEIGGYDARDRMVALKITEQLPVEKGCKAAQLGTAKPLLVSLKQSLFELILDEHNDGRLFVDLDVTRRAAPESGAVVDVRHVGLRIGDRPLVERKVSTGRVPKPLAKTKIRATVTAIEPEDATIDADTIRRNATLAAQLCLARNPRRGGHARGSLQIEISANTVGATRGAKVVVDAFSQPFISHCIEQQILENSEISTQLTPESRVYVALYFRPQG